MTGFLIILALFVGGIASLIRWFEQVTDAVDARHWSRTALLVACPPAVWMYKSRTAAGRPIAVPRHEPVRGFGVGPEMPSDTPRPNQPAPKRAGPDLAAIEKLKQKMKAQGMLDDSDSQS